MNTNDIVSRLWNLCNVLRDDGVTYHQYVTELTYLLFLKMAAETGTESQIPAGYRWSDLAGRDGIEQLNFYRAQLVHLGAHGSSRVQAIFAAASTVVKQPKNLGTLVRSIDGLDWYNRRGSPASRSRDAEALRAERNSCVRDIMSCRMSRARPSPARCTNVVYSTRRVKQFLCTTSPSTKRSDWPRPPRRDC